MHANIMPSGSSLKAISSPGMICQIFNSGRPPANTVGTSDATTANRTIAVATLTVSRWFGRPSDITISTAPTSGIASASAISTGGVMSRLPSGRPPRARRRRR